MARHPDGTPKTGGQLCPACGHFLDAVSQIDLEGSQMVPADVTEVPRPGDATVCIDCAVILIFTDDRIMKVPTFVEMLELRKDKDCWEALKNVQFIIRKVKKDGVH